MDMKWPKWKFQYWKSPMIWDSVILPRTFADASIRYMKCIQSLFVLILSNSSNVEIWNLKKGLVIFSEFYNNLIDYVDFCGLYQHDCEFEVDRIENWSVYMVRKNGLVVCKKCNSTNSYMKAHFPDFSCISQCICRSIRYIKSLILVGQKIIILNCSSLTVLLTISDPMIRDIGYVLVNSDVIVLGSEQNLFFYNISYNIKDKIMYEWKMIPQPNSHKYKILKLIEIDESCLASVSSDSVRIWKRPDFNIIRIFNTWEETGNINEKSIICCLYNSRYLTVALNFGFVILDCTNGSTLAKVSDAHDTKIIGLQYFSNLSMIYTAAEGEVSRFWAFQLTGIEPEVRNQSTSPMSKIIVFNNYFSFSLSKNTDDRKFLGKSMETSEKDLQQISCFLELRHAVKSKNHLVNLEKIGILTSDGSSNLILWRSRDYVFNGLIKMLQMI